MEVQPLVQGQPQARPLVLALLPARVQPLERVPLQVEVRSRAWAQLREPARPAEVLLQGPALVRLPVEARVQPQAEVLPQGLARVPRRSAVGEVRCRPSVHKAERPQ